MSSVTFDKLAYLETLKASGVPEDQARAHASALDAALHDSVVTQSSMQAELKPMKTDIAVIKWMLGFVLAAMLGVFILLLRR